LKNGKLYWKVNEAITAPKVRVIGPDGKQLGIMPIDKAISEAKEKGLTLVEISADAKPPVVKIVDFGKFRYQEEKKLRKKLKTQKAGELKEVRFSPFIDENAFFIKLKKVNGFLEKKNKVKVVVVFKGSQMENKTAGYNLLKRIKTELGEEKIATDMEPKFLGRHLIMIISPKK